MAAKPRSSTASTSSKKKTPTKSKSPATTKKSNGTSKSKAKSTTSKSKPESKSKSKSKSRKRLDSEGLDDEEESSSSDDDDGSDFEEPEEGDDESALSAAVDSDEEQRDEPEEDDDDESEDDLIDEGKKKRRKSGGGGSATKKSKNGDDDLNLRVVKKVKGYPGPETDPATPIILPSTLDFLARLEKNNDRDWFKARDAQYRHALTNVQTLCQAWVPRAAVADWSLPELPVKDLMQRIHRDVRFSKSKIPYRTHLAFSHSRTGRKGPFAIYYLQLGPGGKSLLASGLYAPEAEQVKNIRSAILRDSSPLRDIINGSEFIKYFGKPDAKLGRTSIFGHDDQLKNCPKIEGVTKDHPEIDLLKLRSNAVVHRFTDEEVLSEDFLDKMIEVMEVMAPFVQLLNDWLVPPPSDDEDDGHQPGANGGDDDDDDDDEEAEDDED